MFFEEIAKESDLLKHFVVRHAASNQELLNSVGMDKVLTDPAKDNCWLLCDSETILHVDKSQKPGVDICVGIAASWHDLGRRSVLIILWRFCISMDLKGSAEPLWTGLDSWTLEHRTLPKDIQVHLGFSGLDGSYNSF